MIMYSLLIVEAILKGAIQKASVAPEALILNYFGVRILDPTTYNTSVANQGPILSMALPRKPKMPPRRFQWPIRFPVEL